MNENSRSTRRVAQGEKLRNRGAGVRYAAGVAVALGAALGTAHAQSPVTVFDKSHPESVTSTRDGTLYVGSSISAALRRRPVALRRRGA